jgi:hypothetical protein
MKTNWSVYPAHLVKKPLATDLIISINNTLDIGTINILSDTLTLISSKGMEKLQVTLL